MAEPRAGAGPQARPDARRVARRVVDDPALNDRATLLLLAQGMLADMPDDEAEA